MILPVIIDTVGNEGFRAWVYTKYLYHTYLGGKTMIVQENLVNVPFKIILPELPCRGLTTSEDASVKKFVIPASIFDNLIDDKGDKIAAAVFLNQERYAPLEQVLREFFEEILKKNTIEAICNWGIHCASVKYLAEEYHIPLITNELSTFRHPYYRTLGFFSFTDLYRDDELASRYDAFLCEQEESPLSFEFLSREELLLLLLSDENIDSLQLFRMKPHYEFGFGGGAVVGSVRSKTDLTDDDVLSALFSEYSKEDILLRMHPSDSNRNTFSDNYHLDKNRSALPFILSCKRITALCSNLFFEAMLWNRVAYALPGTPFPYTPFCQNDFSQKEALPVDERFLNYVAFGFLIPAEKAWDPNYIRWRLTAPSEKEIFMRNLKQYLTEWGLDETFLTYPKEKRKAILKRNRKL